MSERCQRFKAILVRRKRLDPASVLATELRRCLSTLDLAVLGIGMMIGPGIFVLTGTLVRHMTGPAVFVSYTITGLVSLLAAFCYAELGARVPRAGSAYLYTYIAIGEPWAFFVGWNMLLEYIVADAATAKTFSASVNALANDVIAKWSLSHLWLGLSFPEGNYPDFVAVLLVIAAVICIGCGVRESVNINNLLTLIIVLVLGLLIGVGFYYADIDNWTEVPGGFMPDGFGGVMLGAAACFYAYVGFESIAVAGEETENPSRSIPIALCVAMTFVTLIYALSSAVLTLMVPYYSVHTAAPFTIAFAQVGAIWAKYVVGIGAIIAISTSVLGQLFVACRILYAMANDGLLFGILAKVNPRTQMPIYAALLCGVLISVLALMVALEILVELVSIGTVMCQAMVSTSVLVLRYRPQAECTFDRRLDPVKSSEDGDNLPLGPDANDNTGKLKKSCQNIWFFKVRRINSHHMYWVWWYDSRCHWVTVHNLWPAA